MSSAEGDEHGYRQDMTVQTLRISQMETEVATMAKKLQMIHPTYRRQSTTSAEGLW